MPPFAVFFADEAAVGLTRVDAPDAATAEAMVMEEHPGAKVHAVDGATVTEENRIRMLGVWLRMYNLIGLSRSRNRGVASLFAESKK